MTGILGDARPTPDLCDPVIGWRSWRVTRSGDDWMVSSPQMGTPWPGGLLSTSTKCHCSASSPRDNSTHWAATYEDLLDDMDEWNEQSCEGVDVDEIRASLMSTYQAAKRGAHSRIAHLVQESECACGINAFGDAKSLLDSPYASGNGCMIVGEVELWGVVRQYQHGWRAEHGRIARVWAVSSLQAYAVRQAADALGFVYAGTLDDLIARAS